MTDRHQHPSATGRLTCSLEPTRELLHRVTIVFPTRPLAGINLALVEAALHQHGWKFHTGSLSNLARARILLEAGRRFHDVAQPPDRAIWS